MSMSVESILGILRSDSIDDPEELLTWLATDGVTVLEEYADLRKRLECYRISAEQWRDVAMALQERLEEAERACRHAVEYHRTYVDESGVVCISLQSYALIKAVDLAALAPDAPKEG